ncbi:MAG: hypothetical protein MUC31_00550 [Bacteroidales bacterium]|jgi:hypothetical protein|nr:hypothetical protein [Bacteroidales bacterium]
MKVFLVIWIPLLLFPFCLYSQGNERSYQEIDENYRQYRVIFDKEVNALDTHATAGQPVNPAALSTIPSRLLQPLDDLPGRIYATGISDPGIDSSLARSQAIYRALLLASMMNGTAVSNLVDHYVQDYQLSSPEFSGQYFDYFEFTSEATCEIAKAAVLQESYTDFGECIVRIEYRAEPGTGPSYVFRTVGVINEFEKDGVFECNTRIESGSKSLADSRAGDFLFICRMVNGLADVESYFQGKLLPVTAARLKYRSPGNEDETLPPEGVKTDRGLWNALLTSVIKALTIEIRSQTGQVKSATDNYSDKTQALSREAVTGTLTFRLDRIFIQDNHLWTFPEQINFSQP